MGAGFVGTPIGAGHLYIPVLTDIPVLGPVLFGQDALVYLSIVLVIGSGGSSTAPARGLILRAVGDNHASAHALGYPVIRIRALAVMFGGACAGLGGAYLSLAYTPMWVEDMTAGRGWIALALVVFASWRPWRLLARRLSVRRHHHPAALCPGLGARHSAQLMSMLPYLTTIVVLVSISRVRSRRAGIDAPACLGKPFVPDR